MMNRRGNLKVLAAAAARGAAAARAGRVLRRGRDRGRGPAARDDPRRSTERGAKGTSLPSRS